MPATENTTHLAASSEEILGATLATKNATVEGKWQGYFEKLNAMRERLAERRSGQIHDVAHDGDSNSNENPANRGTDEYETGAMLGLVSSEQDALYEIDQAIQRMCDGTYGICEASGQPIPEDRLEAIPWTRFAHDVEEELENEAQARKPRHIF